MSSKIKVAKFGGSSLASYMNIIKVVDLITADASRNIIVVSAPGKRYEQDEKITDLLIKCGEDCINGVEPNINVVIERYYEICKGLNMHWSVIDNISEDIKQRLEADKSDKCKYMDRIKAAGEDNCAKLIARYMVDSGINAHYINPKDAGLILSDDFGNARVLPESFKQLELLRNKDGILIFPGFFGYSKTGEIVTFPRGGSDITGSILAAAVKADVYENFTDVDFIFCANPNIIPDAQPIGKLTYREMRELSYSGFSVFHEDALEPVFRAGIPVCVKNTNNPFAEGTFIINSYLGNHQPVTGIASQSGFCGIYISKYMMNREIGFLRKVLSILESFSIPCEHVPSGIDGISIILSEKYLSNNVEELIVQSIKKELLVDHISVQRNLSLVVVVGEGMINSNAVLSRGTGALARKKINVEMISQGPCEISLTFAVTGNNEKKAVQALYAEFFGKQFVELHELADVIAT